MDDQNSGRGRSGRRGSVKVAVTPEMAAFRQDQTRLNSFLWTTEISYGLVLARADTDFPNRAVPARESLGHVESNAWFPNNQGQFKFLRTTGQFLKQAEENTTRLYRLVLGSYYTCFEDYLAHRVLPLREGGEWGPFVKSLSSARLRTAATPLPLHSVFGADLIRLVRNRMVHEPNWPWPVRIDDPKVRGWRGNLLAAARANHWTASDHDIDEAVEHVVGHVAKSMQKARQRGKDLPAEMFYLLFSFTGLDQLACQIEEALLPMGARPRSWIWRRDNKVRRRDLVIG